MIILAENIPNETNWTVFFCLKIETILHCSRLELTIITTNCHYHYHLFTVQMNYGTKKLGTRKKFSFCQLENKKKSAIGKHWKTESHFRMMLENNFHFQLFMQLIGTRVKYGTALSTNPYFETVSICLLKFFFALQFLPQSVRFELIFLFCYEPIFSGRKLVFFSAIIIFFSIHSSIV